MLVLASVSDSETLFSTVLIKRLNGKKLKILSTKPKVDLYGHDISVVPAKKYFSEILQILNLFYRISFVFPLSFSP